MGLSREVSTVLGEELFGGLEELRGETPRSTFLRGLVELAVEGRPLSSVGEVESGVLRWAEWAAGRASEEVWGELEASVVPLMRTAARMIDVAGGKHASALRELSALTRRAVETIREDRRVAAREGSGVRQALELVREAS